MKDLKDMGRSVIIYHPDGDERKFSTYPIPGYAMVSAIVAEPGYVQIVYVRNGKSVGETYGNMPYLFELFNH